MRKKRRKNTLGKKKNLKIVLGKWGRGTAALRVFRPTATTHYHTAVRVYVCIKYYNTETRSRM